MICTCAHIKYGFYGSGLSIHHTPISSLYAILKLFEGLSDGKRRGGIVTVIHKDFLVHGLNLIVLLPVSTSFVQIEK